MLVISNITARRDGIEVLRQASFIARRGAVTGLIGPNGVGKTTLLKTIAGLLPLDGTVKFDGQLLPGLPAARARLIGYLPQGHEVHWPLSVRRTVELGRMPHQGGFGRQSLADRAIVDRCMTATGVSELAERQVTHLSGGERARVMLARVLATEAPILLADEPVAALDPGQQLRILELLRAEAVERNRVVIVVLHELSLAARYCDDLALLLPDLGMIAGPVADVLTPAVLERAYGLPFLVTETGGIPVVIPQGRPR